jgi:hypothetical protein
MSDKKNRTVKHHTVPQFLLRQFALNECCDAVAMYRIPASEFVPRVGVGGVANQRYFYGTQAVENANGEFEGRAAPIIKSITGRADERAASAVPLYGSDGHENLLEFATLQAFRTPAAAGEAAKRTDNLMKGIISRAPSGAPFRDRLDDFQFVYDNTPSVTASHALTVLPVLRDLRYKVLRTAPDRPFILSDHPAVMYNQFLEGRRALPSGHGFAHRGLQLLLPLGPRHTIIFYDAHVYEVGGADGGVVDVGERDVRQLNVLQAASAAGALFFNAKVTRPDVEAVMSEATPHRRDAPRPAMATGLQLSCVAWTAAAAGLSLAEPSGWYRNPEGLDCILAAGRAAIARGPSGHVQLPDVHDAIASVRY